MDWFEVIVKTLLIFAIADLVVFFLKNHSAATRHSIWFVALICVVVLPFFEWLVPKWRLAILPQSIQTIVQIQRDAFREELSSLSSDQTGAQKTMEITAPRDQLGPNPESAKPIDVNGQKPFFISAHRAVNWGNSIVFLWGLGVSLALMPLLAGIYGLRSLKRSSRDISDQPIGDILREVAKGLKIRRPIILIQHKNASMPVTWGVFRPTILLPADFHVWPQARQKMVLAHELAHVQRMDCLTQILAWIVASLYWFNPLSWLAVRRMRMERERACDDLVLRAGSNAAEYADNLLEVARLSRSPKTVSIAAIALAKPTQLEGRLLAILDSQRSRGALSRMKMGCVIVASALLILPLAASRATLKESTVVREIARPDPPTFASQVDYQAGAGSTYCAAGDLDGDGKPDVVTANQHADTISIFRNGTLSHGSEILLQEKIDLPTGKRPFGIVMADIDQDGKLDLAVPCLAGDFVSIYRNTTTAGVIDKDSFSEPVLIACERAPNGLSLADLNGDGRPELVVANNGNGRGNTVSVMENHSVIGKISFGARVNIVTGSQPGDTIVEDIDGDGWLDILACNILSRTLTVIPNLNGRGAINLASFSQKLDFSVGNEQNYPIKIITADYDGDGKTDIMLGNATDIKGIHSTVSVFKNLSTPGRIMLAPRLDIPSGDSGSSCLVSGDLNGDRWPDTVIGNHHGNTISIYMNQSRSGRLDLDSFAPPFVIPINSGPANIAMADLNGDGILDLAVPNIWVGTLSVLQGAPALR